MQALLVLPATNPSTSKAANSRTSSSSPQWSWSWCARAALCIIMPFTIRPRFRSAAIVPAEVRRCHAQNQAFASAAAFMAMLVCGCMPRKICCVSKDIFYQ